MGHLAKAGEGGFKTASGLDGNAGLLCWLSYEEEDKSRNEDAC